ncbi:MAG: type II toxin-antitoxin system RelE/ParE family toxin [Planctomycetota bacterium]|nr:type II toxin-antitoxin system RelE/ParE family toxin [Planctomycetota bacterium]
MSEAQSEFLEAYLWYDRRQPGLGETLAEEIEHALAIAVEFPDAFAEVARGIRAIRLKRFHEYAIYYEQTSDGLVVYAFYHAKRDPKGLAKRIGPPLKKRKKGKR